MGIDEITVRRARAKDLAVLGRFGAALGRRHVDFDSKRFVVEQPAEPIFRDFFARELAREDAAVLVAEADGAVVGYAFLRREPASLEELRGEGVWLHDLYVDEAARGKGAGRSLLEAARDAARELGSDHVMLSVSPHNAEGQNLFRRMGFRATMVEMRAEIEPAPRPDDRSEGE